MMIGDYTAEFARPRGCGQGKVRYRGRCMTPNKPMPSSRPEKKRMVLVKRGDRMKLVHYGAKGYKHNYSDSAKKSYLARSGGIKNKSGGLTKDDPFSPNHWARKDLWPGGKADGGTKYGRKKR